MIRALSVAIVIHSADGTIWYAECDFSLVFYIDMYTCINTQPALFEIIAAKVQNSTFCTMCVKKG